MKTLCAILGLWCNAFTGPATVVDGDTIKIEDQAIRLAGIDAEELREPNGPAARGALNAIVSGRIVECSPVGVSYKRVVALCAVGWNPEAKGPRQMLDIGALMVLRGYALDCARYSGGKYRELEPPGARARLLQKPYC